MRPKHIRLLVRILMFAALALTGLDVVVWLTMALPSNSRATAEEARSSLLRQQLLAEQTRHSRLERIQTEGADVELIDFLSQRVPPRQHGFSRAAHLLGKLTEQTGVQMTGVAYRLQAPKEDPFESLAMELTVQGPFQSTLAFAHALETADELLVLRSFNFEPVENGIVALKVSANLLVTP